MSELPENMNINEVCNNLLDNADVTLDFSQYPKIVLSFIVAGTVDSRFWEVEFVLESVVSLNITNDFDPEASPNDSYLVFEANVQNSSHDSYDAYIITMASGDIDFKAKTVGFSWQALPFTANEFRERHPHVFSI